MKRVLATALLAVSLMAMSITVCAESTEVAESTTEAAESTEVEEGTEAAEDTESAGGLTVTQKQLYNFPGASRAMFFAKIENTGDAPIAFGDGKLEVFSENDDILASSDFINTLPLWRVLDAGEYVYISESLYEEALENAAIGDVKLSVQEKEAELGKAVTRIPAEATYEIEGADTYKNFVNVTFTNETDKVLYDYYITSAILDAEGNLLFVGKNYYETLGVHPNSTVTIKMYIDDKLCEYYEVNGITPASAEATVCVENE